MRNIRPVPVETLDIKYNGPALDEHTMDVRTLAPSLLALADAFQAAQAALDPAATAPSVHIVADPRGGSFQLQLLVDFGLLTQQVLTSAPATAAANAASLVTWVKEAMSAVKWLRNRPASKTPLPSGTIRYTTADGDSLEIPAESSTILETPKFRAEINAVVQPVRRPGIDSLSFDGDNPAKVPVIIDADDAEAFGSPELESGDDIVNEREMLVNIVTVPFRNNLKWKLNDGTQTFTADLDDLTFRGRIHRREVAFAEGDQLRILLKEVQTRNPVTRKLSVSRSVERVLDHIPTPIQGQLFEGDS